MSTKVMDRDWIVVNELSVQAPLGASHWSNGKEHLPQPLHVTVSVPFSIARAASSDSLLHSVNYSDLAKSIEALVSSQRVQNSCPSLESFAIEACEACLHKFSVVQEVKVRVEKLRAHLHAKGVALEVTRLRQSPAIAPSWNHFCVRDLELSTIIGIRPWERLEKQVVRVNMELNVCSPQSSSGGFVDSFDYKGLVDSVINFISASSYKMMESLVSGIAHSALSCPSAYLESGLHRISSITVSLAKPSAMMFASSGEVRITRTPQDFSIEVDHPRQQLSRVPDDTPAVHIRGHTHIVALALGSNLNDRVSNIEKALATLGRDSMRVLSTSFMYESNAMYVEDQPKFANAVCLIETNLDPQGLLRTLKQVETSVGRTPTFRNGPRVVDLDIILYDDLVVSESGDDSLGKGELIVPHPRMLEREFVLRPLADIVPNVIHPVTGKSIKWHLNALASSGPSNSLSKLISFPSSPAVRPEEIAKPLDGTCWSFGKRTYIMATLNATPDSFSDGGLHLTTSKAVAYSLDAVAKGADIVDVGGFSTRPGAPEVSLEEELRRVIPVIQALRDAGISCPISVDTFRPEVARQAVLAGANCVNDVRALREEGMREAVKELGVPVVMMHSRGTDAGKQKSYAPHGVMAGVRDELGADVKKALHHGIRRWNIVVDPGIGFSKTLDGNLELIRNLKRFTERGAEIAHGPPGLSNSVEWQMPDVLASMPVLVGTSRKSYLGAVIERPQAPPGERDAATLAASVAAIQQGCDILRVHDVGSAKDASRVADALWRI